MRSALTAAKHFVRSAAELRAAGARRARPRVRRRSRRPTRAGPSSTNVFNRTPMADRSGASLPVRAQFTSSARTGQALLFLPRAGSPAGDWSADDVLELNVHLREGLVRMAHAAAGPAHQRIAVAQDRAHGADLVGGAGAAARQTHRVQVLQPLAVLHAGHAAGQVFAMPRVDQADLDAGLLQDLEEGGSHRRRPIPWRRCAAAFFEPIADEERIIGEGAAGLEPASSGTATWRSRHPSRTSWRFSCLTLDEPSARHSPIQIPCPVVSIQWNEQRRG